MTLTPATAASATGHQVSQPEIVIVDADTAVLESLPLAIANQRAVKICGRSLDVQSGLEICRALNPDVLLVSDECFRAEFRLLADFLPIRMKHLRLSVFADRLTDLERMQAIAMPATGFCSRKDSISDLSNSLTSIAKGRLYVSSHLGDRIEVNEDGTEFRLVMEQTFKKLTNLQLQVLVHIANGMRVKDVAKKMHLSMKAIESHKYRIMQVLGVHDRLGLCRFAIREGLVEA